MKSVSLLVVFALAAVASAADPYKFDRDFKIEVYSAMKSLYAAAPISALTSHIQKDGQFSFSSYPFKFYPEGKIHGVVAAFKPKGENFLQAFYFNADASNNDDTYHAAVRPIYEHLSSGEYYAFTPIAAKQAAPQYFNLPLKKVTYDYYKDVDVEKATPVVILVPKSEVDEAALKDFILIAEYEVSQDTKYVIHDHFGTPGKNIERRDVFYTSPYYRAYPYEYAPAYYYGGYPYSYYGYPEMRTWHL